MRVGIPHVVREPDHVLLTASFSVYLSCFAKKNSKRELSDLSELFAIELSLNGLPIVVGSADES